MGQTREICFLIPTDFCWRQQLLINKAPFIMKEYMACDDMWYVNTEWSQQWLLLVWKGEQQETLYKQWCSAKVQMSTRYQTRAGSYGGQWESTVSTLKTLW